MLSGNRAIAVHGSIIVRQELRLTNTDEICVALTEAALTEVLDVTK